MGRTMWSLSAAPSNKQANISAPSNIALDSTVHGCSQMRMPLTRSPGATRSNENQATRCSKGARFLGRVCIWIGLGRGLEPIFFHPPVQSAAAQAQSFRGLAHVALKALQRFANQNTFYGLQTQFFQVL